MYTDSITMMDAFVITLFSMGLVFIALVVLSYSIDGINAVLNRKKKEVQKNVSEDAIEIKEKDDQELIAVISAAIASATGKSLSSFLVKSVHQRESNESSWAKAGRIDAMR